MLRDGVPVINLEDTATSNNIERDVGDIAATHHLCCDTGLDLGSSDSVTVDHLGDCRGMDFSPSIEAFQAHTAGRAVSMEDD